jgi:hypothetical protein
MNSVYRGLIRTRLFCLCGVYGHKVTPYIRANVARFLKIRIRAHRANC